MKCNEAKNLVEASCDAKTGKRQWWNEYLANEIHKNVAVWYVKCIDWKE